MTLPKTADPMARRDPTVLRRCGAKNRQGNPCKAFLPDGWLRCKNHGGASPQALRVAEETLAEWRMRRVAQLDKGFDVLLNDVDGRRLAALIAKQPGLIARLLETADRMRGGSERIALEGPDGGPVAIKVVVEDPRHAAKPKE